MKLSHKIWTCFPLVFLPGLLAAVISTTAVSTPTSNVVGVDIKTDQSFQCGLFFGGKQCPDGLCCASNGTCGNTPEYCDTGCQFQYGLCDSMFPIASGDVSAAGTLYCGGSYGSCPAGQCCGPEGICSTEDWECDIGKGCNPAFGTCLPVAYQCGPMFGNQLCSASSWCCSSVGYCGQGPEYCLRTMFCTSECDGDVRPTTTTSTSTSSSTMSLTTSSSSSSLASASSTFISPAASSSATSSSIVATVSPVSSSTAVSGPSIVSSSVAVSPSSVSSSGFSPISTITLPLPTMSPQYSKDGSCGPSKGNVLCPPGTCCSKWGFCGISKAHCRSDCLYQCTDGDGQAAGGVASISLAPSPAVPNNVLFALPGGECGSLADGSYKYCPGNQCCSKWNYCGDSEVHCTTGCASQCRSPAGIVAASVDFPPVPGSSSLQTALPGRQCGLQSNGTFVKCPANQCCSKWNFCGTSELHCLTDCQDNCKKENVA